MRIEGVATKRKSPDKCRGFFQRQHPKINQGGNTSLGYGQRSSPFDVRYGVHNPSDREGATRSTPHTT